MNRRSRIKLAQAFVALLERHTPQQLVPALAQAIVELRLKNQVDLLIKDINNELLKTRGHLEADVVSARHLSDGVVEQLEQLIKQVSGARTVEFNQSIDKNLLGGLIASTPELEIDLSIRTKLRKLEAKSG